MTQMMNLLYQLALSPRIVSLLIQATSSPSYNVPGFFCYCAHYFGVNLGYSKSSLSSSSLCVLSLALLACPTVHFFPDLVTSGAALRPFMCDFSKHISFHISRHDASCVFYLTVDGSQCHVCNPLSHRPPCPPRLLQSHRQRLICIFPCLSMQLPH